MPARRVECCQAPLLVKCLVKYQFFFYGMAIRYGTFQKSLSSPFIRNENERLILGLPSLLTVLAFSLLISSESLRG